MSPAAPTSAIVADTSSGCHHLRIDGYSSLKALPSGRRFSSRSFTVGGRRWRIDYYPNGRRHNCRGHVSVCLLLDEDAAAAEEVTAWFRFSLAVNRWFSFLGKAKPRTSPARKFGGAAKRKSRGFPRFVKCQLLEKSKHLNRDSFTVRCEVVVINGVRHEGRAKKPSPKVVSVPPSDLNQHLGGLLLTGKGADVVFEAGGETFAAHRCVLAARSPVFSVELFGSMKEGSSTSDLVRIHDMEPQVFRALLCFVYTDSLPEMKTEEEPEMKKEEAPKMNNEQEEPEMEKEDENIMCQHLLVAADRYNMDRLKLVCEDKLCKYIDVGTAANMLALAEAHHCHVLKGACFDFLRSAANLIPVVANDGFEHLRVACPSLVKELFAMHSPPLAQ
ncbi:hypothetical protein ZWY2020_039067 [Hordeum vulgare]|nr:hypothetical protein ZWY2020_039067 [Hordeum vulgare]